MIGVIDGFFKWCKSIVRPIFRSSVTMPSNIASAELIGAVEEGPDIVILVLSVVVCWKYLAELVGRCAVHMSSVCESAYRTATRNRWCWAERAGRCVFDVGCLCEITTEIRHRKH